MEKKAQEEKAVERREDRERLLVGLEAGACGCAHLAISGASATILSCEFKEVEVRGGLTEGRELQVQLIRSCMPARTGAHACVCASVHS